MYHQGSEPLPFRILISQTLDRCRSMAEPNDRRIEAIAKSTLKRLNNLEELVKTDGPTFWAFERDWRNIKDWAKNSLKNRIAVCRILREQLDQNFAKQRFGPLKVGDINESEITYRTNEEMDLLEQNVGRRSS
jgi:hypothetical protein